MQGVSWWLLTSLWSSVALLCLSAGQPSSSEGRRTSHHYYDTLGVQPTATDRQVKKAFHKLAMTYHPDKNKSPDAEKVFREIAEAYGVLSNKEKRRRYDALGHQAFLSTEDGSAHSEARDAEAFFHFSFDQMFQDDEMFRDDEMFQDDDEPFPEEHVYWNFQPGVEFVDDPFGDERMLMDDDLFDLLDDPRYGHEEGRQVCWKSQRPDGSIVEMCDN